MKLVFDSTPLIYLAKTGLLKQIFEVKCEKIIPKTVFNECTKALQKYSYGLIIFQAVKEKKLKVKEYTNKNEIKRLTKISSLSFADSETLLLAKSFGAIAIVDEKEARNIAEIKNVRVHGSAFILALLVKNSILTKKEAIEKLDEMIEEGWYCSTDLYLLIRKAFENY